VPETRSSAALVGREAELAALIAAYDRAAAGALAVVLLGGETGSGKTRMLAEFLATTRRRAATHLVGSAPALSGHELPYAPVTSALRELGEELGDPMLRSMIPPESELSRLLPRSHESPKPSTVEDAGSQLRLFEEFLALLSTLGSRRPNAPVIFAVEDLHWADSCTRDLLAYLIHNLSRAHVLLVATYRSTEAMASEPLRRLLLESVRRDAVVEVDLGPLDDAESSALLASLGGPKLAPDHAANITRLAGGNPLFIERLAKGSSDASIPRSLVNLVQDQITRLSPQAQQTLRVAAVGGPSTPAIVIEACAIALGVDPVAAIGELRSAGMLEARVVDGIEVHAFRHTLLQEVVYASMISAERARLHGELAARLELQLGGLPTQPPWVIELARHWWSAGEMARAFPILVAAAQNAEHFLAFAEAHALYERALTARKHAAAQPPNRRPIGFGEPGRRTDGPTQRTLEESAAQTASLAGHPDRAAEIIGELLSPLAEKPVALEARLGQYLWEAGQHEGAFKSYRSAIARLPETATPERASILRTAARTFLLAGKYQEAKQFATEAANTATQVGAVSDQIDALTTLGATLAHLGQADAAVAALAEARRIEEERQRVSRIQPRPSRIVDVLSGYWGKAVVLERAGESEQSAAAALAGLERARKLGVERAWGGLVGAAAVDELIDLGRWTEADNVLSDLLATPQPRGLAQALHARSALLATRRGDFSSALEQLSIAGPVASGSHEPGTVEAVARANAELGIWSNQLSEVIETLTSLVRTMPIDGDPRPLTEMIVLALRALADRAELGRARGSSADVTEAERETAVLHGRALAVGALGGPGPKVLALVEMAAAEFHRALGDAEASAWVAVAGKWDALRDRYRGAYARWRAAQILLANRGGREEGTELILAAHSICAELGARPLQQEIEGLATRARVDIHPATAVPKGPVRPPADDAGLSPRELEVLGLLAQGQTNRQIAQALFISEKTAGHHVSSILGKLGVSGRVAAAGVAIRLGLGPT
jgi:DNA-binding CsgD family transcriptional regulator